MLAAVAAVAALVVAGATLDVAGETRSYEVFAPDGVRAGAPLVIVLHGRLGTGAQVRRDSGFDEVARTHGFVVAYPDGVDRAWRDLRQVTQRPDARFGSNDVELLHALIARLAATHAIDTTRVFLVGHSNGAIMALTYACLRAGEIAGVAVVAGALPQTGCALDRPLAALMFHGTRDPLVKFEGGGVGRRGQRGFVMSNDETFEVFARAAGCTGTQVQQRAPAQGERIALRLEERTGCRAPVRRVVLEGGGHGWPGRGPLWKDNTRALDASAEIGAFFASLAVRAPAPAKAPEAATREPAGPSPAAPSGASSPAPSAAPAPAP